MIIDEDCLMRGAAHRFLLVKLPLIEEVDKDSAESLLFYAYVSKLGELIFALVAIKEEGGFRKLDKWRYFSARELDNCHCEIVDPSLLSDELRAVQEELENENAVSQDRLHLREMSGLDPYRLVNQKDVLKVYGIHDKGFIFVLGEREKNDYIIGRRMLRTEKGIVETEDEVVLILIRHQYSLEIYAQ